MENDKLIHMSFDFNNGVSQSAAWELTDGKITMLPMVRHMEKPDEGWGDFGASEVWAAFRKILAKSWDDKVREYLKTK
jgi:hypothetical protein